MSSPEEAMEYLNKKVAPMIEKHGYWDPSKGLEQYPDYREPKIDDGPYVSKQEILKVLRDELSSLEKIDEDELEFDSDYYGLNGKREECKNLIALFEEL